MGIYRARPCPNCNYYLAFSTARPPFKSKETSITSFCLNCSYKLPISAIIRGTRRPTPPFRRGALRLASVTVAAKPSVPETQGHMEIAEKSFAPLDYPRHLRVIGQDLENLRLKTFNLECTGDSYLVWSRYGSEPHPLARLSRSRLQKLWRHKLPSRSQGQEERFTLPSSRQVKRYRYSPRDIQRMEEESRARRRPKGSMTDGHSLSQLLRTVGALVGQRRDRLLGISWQDFSVSVVVETAQRTRRIDVFRPDNLYDLWVRMYLRRDHRALSDFPR
jgi:hypothetical protein